MSADYTGLTRNTWPGTWSPSSPSPIALDTELRGTLQSISGLSGDRLTDIPGQRIQEGMLVYIKTGYTVSGHTRSSDSYYTYKLSSGQVRDPITGSMPNLESNWSSSNLNGTSSFDFGTFDTPYGPMGFGLDMGTF